MGGIFLLYNARPNALRRVFVTEPTRRNDAKLVARDATKIYIYRRRQKIYMVKLFTAKPLPVLNFEINF